MSISSDEVNYLIYRYLQENGFTHTAFSFEYESMVTKSSVSQTEIPPGALITFLQKGLEYVGIEEHINEDGSIREFDRDYSLLSPFVCDAVALKDDRRHRRINHSASAPAPASSSSSSSSSGPDSESVPMEEVNGDGSSGESAPIGGTVGLASPQNTIAIRNDGGTKLMQLIGHQGEVFMCVWNPQQLQLASGSADGMCRLWGLADLYTSSNWDSTNTASITTTVDQLPIRTSVLPHSQFMGERFKDVTSVTWSPDGNFLATGCYDGIARVWDSQGELKLVLKEHTGPVFSLKWNKRGDLLLSGSYDRRAIVWDVVTGTVLKQFLLHSAPVLDVDWRDSDCFATCSSDKTIFICSVSSVDSSPITRFHGHEDEVNAVCWSPGGTLLASCSDDSTAKIWSMQGVPVAENGVVAGSDPSSSGLLLDLRGHTKEIYTARWTPTGLGSNNPDKLLRLCTASFDGSVKIWNAETGALVHTLRRQAQPVYSIAPNPRGELLATGSLGGYVSVFSLVDGSLVREIRGGGDTFDVSWSHDGTMLSSCFSSGALHVLDTRS